MGAGASTNASAYSVADKAAIMHALGDSYAELSSTGSLTDVELYAQMTAKFESLNGSRAEPTASAEAAIISDGNDVLTNIASAAGEKQAAVEATATTPAAGKDNPGIVRLDSVADVPVEVVVEQGEEDDDEKSTYDTTFDTGAAILAHPTSTELLKDMIDEQAQQDKKIAEFMTSMVEGNVKTSKASGFRTRRLTYAQKTIEDPEPPSPDKLQRQRTTIYASSEIGVRQEKKAPFPDTILGTFSCHGIEPGTEVEPLEGEEEEEEKDEDEESYGPVPHDKINQDRGCVVSPFLQKANEALFLVLDGHGEQGDKISEFVMRQLVSSLDKSPMLESDPPAALKDTFVMTNMALMTTSINYMTSGTTCVCCYLRDTTLYVANCGDSRAVMAVRQTDGTCKAKDLSRDHKPDDEDEAHRIKEWGGFIRPAPEPGLSARVYLDEKFTMIGLAMARSIGDFAVKAVGVIAEPEITQFEVDINDQFMIMASDGVWEFIGSQEAVDIVQEKLAAGCNCTQACQELIEQASQRWAEEEGDYRDDITCIVVKYPLPFHSLTE